MYYLSPSRIARYFYHECDRYLRYHATPKERRKSEGVPPIEWDISPVTRAMLDAGFRWEEEVIKKHLRGKAKIAPARGKGGLTELSHSFEETIELLGAMKPGDAIYQATLNIPDSFYKRFGIDPKSCYFHNCRPDLLQLSNDKGPKKLRVIDIKASNELKTSHRIQVTLYTIILQEIFREQGIAIELDTETAGIWLSYQKEPEWFDQRISAGIIDQFLGGKMQKILATPVEEVPWHLFFRCEWCEFYESCREEADRTGSISLIPYLSVGGRKFLRDRTDTRVNSLDELASFLKEDTAEYRLGCCGSLRGKRDRLGKAVTALKKNRIEYYGGSSIALPINEHVNIAVTLQSDPVSGRIYAAGFRRAKGKDVYDSGTSTGIFIAANPDDCERVKHDFITALYKELEVLDTYNAGRIWKDQKSLQTYVYDGYELSLFNEMLIEAAGDAELAPMALKLLFHYQDTSLADADEHPHSSVPFPVIVITGVLQDLLALPIPVSFRLPDVYNIIKPDATEYRFEPSELFWFNLSNTMKSDSIYKAWYGDRSDAIGWIEGEVKRRLSTAQSVIDGLRDHVKETLFAWPPKFRFPDAFNFKHSELSRLAFIVHYESFMAAVSQRTERTSPMSERIRDGISIPLKLEDSTTGRWRVQSDLDVTDLEESDFFNFIIVPGGPEGERAQMGYDDFYYRKAFYSPANSLVRLAKVRNVIPDKKTGLITHINIEIPYAKGQEHFRGGNLAVLHPRFTDFNSDRIIDRMKEIDSLKSNDFISLIKDPPRFAEPVTITAGDRDAALSIADKTAGFTPSQRKSFEQFIANRLTLVWGPPGTGKTHFLSKAILCLSRWAKENKKQLHIAVTAFTHAAIENLLEEIRHHMQSFGLQKGVPLYKLKYTSTPRGENLTVLAENDLIGLTSEELLIVGGTVYSFNKSKIYDHFPVLIVDEASQLKFGELALVMKVMGRGGRLLLAGDDLQLPPIIQGEYPDREDGLPGLHDSIFAYLRARDSENSPFTSQLLENWRMNNTLCDFAAKTLYSEDYKPASKAIRNRKIALKSVKIVNEKDEFSSWLADPNHPLVVGILEDVQATVENEAEARIVALLTGHFRNNLLSSGGDPYPDSVEGDRLFWRHGLFIVSPHHAQIASIRKELSRIREWHTRPFVDTVDKMQGQQCNAVIVSYGVSDSETAMNEAEFIYSLNRLNVSVTRAQAKCIVFLPRPLLDASFAVLEKPKAARGLNHMLALVEYCKKHGDAKEFDLGFIGYEGRITLLRAGL